MHGFLTRWIVLTIAAAVMVVLLPGMRPIGHPPILGIAAFALFLALINASLRPVMNAVTQVLALPLTVMSLGLAALVALMLVNWVCMELASWLALTLFGVGVTVSGVLAAAVGAVVMALVSSVVNSLIGA
ncbi:phage holin family protein [Bifidobacterium sp. ESL0763]|uniref:phage holin family protein n=1 Tax=Bifidobacterium sp. ESL0763 TaxID=2983227 RepID=UPI0023F83C0B|nr:phage holin family protein [Bifidobacterium sp. ESL0763]MDF7663917.1 phage holin family protein [Bifidobacterium sp. ESL0763]